MSAMFTIPFEQRNKYHIDSIAGYVEKIKHNPVQASFCYEAMHNLMQSVEFMAREYDKIEREDN